MKQLSKTYSGTPPKHAVKKLSFGIPMGECFGFLGINGAGKTSTLKILSGEQLPTAGGAALGGLDILTQQVQVRRLLGYCPQFDALLEMLTVREHLQLYARMKGVSEAKLEEVVQQKMKEMDLLSFENKLAGTLSGGNKRKLSVGIAMIGSPSIIFLDEPSTGMDPVARRFMWDVIARVATEQKRCSIMLTTHSMEEVQALCTRVGIMVGGQLRCLGSIQHLKDRFGKGYQLDVKLQDVEESRRQEMIDKFTLPAEITTAEMAGVLQKVHPAYVNEVSASGKGWMIHSTLQRMGANSSSSLVEWVVLQQWADHLLEVLVSTFGKVDVLEARTGFVRYQLPPVDGGLASVFSELEKRKQELHILEYSVSQTSIEQIFNYFASQQDEEKAPAGLSDGVNYASAF